MWVQLLLVALGVITVLLGVVMIYPPLALILGGSSVCALGFFWDDLTRSAQ